jgi:hypothetical protein
MCRPFRSPWLAACAPLLSCALEVEDGFSLGPSAAFSAGDETGPSEESGETPADLPYPVPQDPDEADGGDADTGDGDGDVGDGDGDGDAGDGDGDDDGGMQPADGMYSHCTSGAECEPGLGCLIDDGGIDGFCSRECTGYADPENCDPSPGGTATPRCIVVASGNESLNVCALDCAGGKTCPGGMICKPDADEEGPIEICM